jgi:hypothetical protein
LGQGSKALQCHSYTFGVMRQSRYHKSQMSLPVLAYRLAGKAGESFLTHDNKLIRYIHSW